MKKTLITASIFLILLTVSLSMPPPWNYYPEKCEDSGGNWPGETELNYSEWQEGNYSTQSCICPENTSLLWGECWKKTPKKACEELGGEVTTRAEEGKTPIAGPPGANFLCVDESDGDLTEKVMNNSFLANQEMEETPEKTEEDSGGYQWLFTYALLGLAALLAGTLTGKYLRKRKES